MKYYYSENFSEVVSKMTLNKRLQWKPHVHNIILKMPDYALFLMCIKVCIAIADSVLDRCNSLSHTRKNANSLAATSWSRAPGKLRQDACALSRHCEPAQANSWSRARNLQEDWPYLSACGHPNSHLATRSWQVRHGQWICTPALLGTHHSWVDWWPAAWDGVDVAKMAYTSFYRTHTHAYRTRNIIDKKKTSSYCKQSWWLYACADV